MPASSSPALAAAREQLTQSLSALASADQKLSSLLGFAGIILGLIFAVPARAHAIGWLLWLGRILMLLSILLTVGGLLAGPAVFGRPPSQPATLGDLDAAWTDNMSSLTVKVLLFQTACVLLLLGLAAATLAIA
jgi:hypothetical protein